MFALRVFLTLAAILYTGLIHPEALHGQEKADDVTNTFVQKRKQAFALLKQDDLPGCLSILDELTEQGPAKLRVSAAIAKFSILLGQKNQEEAAAHVTEIGKRFSNQNAELGDFAWVIVDSQQKGNQVEQKVIEAGIELCQTSLRTSPNNWKTLTSLAHLQKLSGDLSTAIETQKRAVSACDDPLRRYQAQNRLVILENDNLPEAAQAALKQAMKISKKGQEFLNKQQYADAIKIAQEANKILTDNQLTDHPVRATVLKNLGMLYALNNDSSKATQYLTDSKAAFEKKFGKENESYHDVLTALAKHYQKLGQHSQAEPLFIEAKSLSKKIWGGESSRFVADLGQLAISYFYSRQFSKAEAICQELREHSLKVNGKRSPGYALSLNELGRLYSAMGYLSKASRLFVEAKSINSEVLGNKHPEYQKSLENLAQIYRETGDNERLEPLQIEITKLSKDKLGKEHPVYASNLSLLANFYKSTGNYAKAEPLLIETKGIFEKTLGKENPSYNTTLTLLADLYSDIGEYEKAESAYHEAQAILGKLQGKSSPRYMAVLDSLARLKDREGNSAQAEAMYKRIRDTAESSFGKNHSVRATSLSQLAKFYIAEKRHTEAEALLLEAQVVYENAVGKLHRSYIESLKNLAELYQNTNDYDKAEKYYLSAKNANQKVFGTQSKEYTSSLIDLVQMHEEAGDLESARSYLLEATEIYREVFGTDSQKYADSLKHLTELNKKTAHEPESKEPLQEPPKLGASGTKKSTSVKTDESLRQAELVGMMQHESEKAISAGDFSKAVEIRKNALAEEEKSPTMATCYFISKLAEAYELNNDWQLAVETRVKASRIAIQKHGDKHWRSIETAQNLIDTKQIASSSKESQQRWASVHKLKIEAKILLSTARTVDQAIELYERIAKITADAFGKKHPKYAEQLNRLGVGYGKLNRTAQSVSFFKQAIKIYQDQGWKLHPDYATCLANLGNTFLLLGKLSEAEPLFIKALEVNELALGKDDLRYVDRLKDLAGFYATTEDERAAALYEQSLEIAWCGHC